MVVTSQQLIMIYNLNISIELYLVISSIFHQLTMQASMPMATWGWSSTQLVWIEIEWIIDIVAGLYQFFMQDRGGQNKAVMQQYQEKAEYFMCACLQKNGYSVQRTSGLASSIFLRKYIILMASHKVD